MQGIQKLFAIGDKEKKEKEKTLEKFDKKLSAKLSAAATAKSWSDLLPIYKEIHNFLNTNKEYNFHKITDKILLGKRLAQGLNPECPSGLHDVILDVYELLLSNIIANNNNKLMDNLHIYSYGLFPFFPNATLQNKGKFLDKIIKGIFINLNEDELKICLPGLLSSLIPGLDDNNEETTKLIYKSFDDLSSKDEKNFFGVYWMLLLRCNHLRNSGIKYLLEKVSKYSDIKTMEENKRKEIIEKQFPNINTTVINALCEIIKDKDVPLVRNGMDFILTRLPLSKENTMVSDEAKINLINSGLYLFVKNEYSTIRRLKSLILGLENQDDEVDYNSEDIKYKMGLVIKAFENLFKQDNNLKADVIKNNILIFERFLESDEEFVNQILSNTAYPLLKSVVNYWEKILDSSEERINDQIISQTTKFFKNKNKKYFECLWNSLAKSIIIEIDKIGNIDDILSPLKFSLYYIYIETDEERIKYYIPIITNILCLINQIPRKRDEFKKLKSVVMIALAYIRTLQETEFQEKNEEIKKEKNDNKKDFNNTKTTVANELYDLTGKENWTLVAAPSMRKSHLTDLFNEDDDLEEESKINDVYQISEKSNLNSILNYDKNLLGNLSENIAQFQEYYIGILNEFLSTNKKENKISQITKFEIGFFRQIAELTIRLQEYNQGEENEIPKWIKYLEKIIFNSKDNNVDDLLPIEAANILLDLNLSFSKKKEDNIYNKIKKNFCSEEIDTQIIELNFIDEIYKRMNVQKNCYDLLLAKFYLLSEKQRHMNSNMEILLKIFYFNKKKFFDIIYSTLYNEENLYINIKLFSNFWKTVNEYYPEENFFKKETIFRMLDFLEDQNPTLRHLSKTWLNQANQLFNKIIDPIFSVLLDKEIVVENINDKTGGRTEFLHEFNISEILKAFNKLKNIIINSNIMPFLENKINDEILSMIRFSSFSKNEMNYLQALISTLLHFIRTKSKKDLKEDFIKEVFSLNAASTEFLEFLLKNIKNYEFLIQNTTMINNIILGSLIKSLEEKDEVMSVQLLDVLKSLYFNYPPGILKIPENKIKYISLLMNFVLEDVINKGMIFDHFYIREHFISFTKQLVETFFDYISIEDKDQLKQFYQLCNRFIEPLVNLISTKVVLDNKIKTDTNSFSHYDGKHNQLIYKNYCEEYKEYKTYDESEVLAILKGIEDIISKCFTNQIQAKNKEMGTDKGIKLFYIPIPFIKKKAIIKTGYEGNWQEYKKKLANDIKSNNAFVSFMTTIFDFVDENPNKEIKDMSSDLYHNQIFNLLKSFLTIWINQSEKYERFDYCLNPNGILSYNKIDSFQDIPKEQIEQAIKNIENNPIKSVILRIANNLFFTDSIKFIENIMSLWSQEQKRGKDNDITIKDKQYKLSIIELLISMDIPIHIILFCVGAYLQKSFANNNNQKKYIKIKEKEDKFYKTPIDVSIREAKIFHFIYSYILLNPKRYDKINEKGKTDTSEISEIWKEIINIITNTMNESKILYTYCWLYEILQLTSQKYSLSGIDTREIRNGIENIFNGITSKLIDAVFSSKYDSKYFNDAKLVLPYLPHVYSNIVTELYKDNDLYKKNSEGSKNIDSDFNQKSFKSKKAVESIDKKKTILKNTVFDEISLNVRKKSISQSLVVADSNEPLKQEETETSIIKFYENIIRYPKTSDEFDNSINVANKNDIIEKNKLNTIYQLLAFITLKENFYSMIKAFFDDNIKSVSKYYNEILIKLLQTIKVVKSESIYNAFAHSFLGSLTANSPKNISICGKDALMEYIKSPKLFEGTPGELHEWKNIIQLFSNNYNEILHDLIKDLNDKNIFVKKKDEDKCRILRRVSFVIYSCEKDYFSKNFALIKSKAKDLLSDFNTNSSLEKEIFLLLRMLFLRFSHDAVMQMIRDLWPIIFTELIKNINSYIKNKPDFSLILEPYKFIELLSLVNIEEFSLYQWIFMLDTFDLNDCDIRNNNSFCKKLIIDQKNQIFKPLTVEILKINIGYLNDNILEGKKKAKNELIIDADTDERFRNQINEFFYSIGDMNSFKVDANYDKIAENIEKDFIFKTKEEKSEKNEKKNDK